MVQTEQSELRCPEKNGMHALACLMQCTLKRRTLHAVLHALRSGFMMAVCNNMRMYGHQGGLTIRRRASSVSSVTNP